MLVAVGNAGIERRRLDRGADEAARLAGSKSSCTAKSVNLPRTLARPPRMGAAKPRLEWLRLILYSRAPAGAANTAVASRSRRVLARFMGESLEAGLPKARAMR
jgi:hypothetical protein